MKPACLNHPDRNATSLGLCQACYMRQRRAEKRAAYLAAYNANQSAGIKGVTTGGTTSPVVGAGVVQLLAAWSHDAEVRFRAKIDATGGADACHVWGGTRTKAGYGMITLHGYTVLAHRLAHALVTGDVAAPVVMHACDNPSCVNPAHLRSGTHAENAADMRTKGRGASPQADHLRVRDRHPAAKAVLTPRGEFPSATLAAEAFGLHPRVVAGYCQTGAMLGGLGYHRAADDDQTTQGWRYRD